MKTDDLIPLSEITPEAREIAVAWIENYQPMGFDIQQKHKLASDIMNYAAGQVAAERERNDDDTYYLKGPSEFTAPVEKEHECEFFLCNDDRAYLCECGNIEFNHVEFYPEEKVKALQEENARLRSLIEELFCKSNNNFEAWEQFKKDNNL